MKIEMQIKWLQRAAEECLEDERPLAAEKYAEIAESLRIQLTEGKVMRAALEDIHQYEGTSYAHARTVAHQGLSGEYSAQVGQSEAVEDKSNG